MVAIGHWFDERRSRRLHARHRRQVGCCPVCMHPWGEHSDAGNDEDGVCGECNYEIEHAEESLVAPTRCTLRGPADLVGDFPDRSERHAWQESVCPCHPQDCGQLVTWKGGADLCDLPPDADVHRH